MVQCRRTILVFLTLILGGSLRLAADSAEDRAYNAAAKPFQTESWSFAEKKFGEFVEKFPNSPRVSEAILFQAKSGYRLNDFDETVGLLSTNRARAGMWEDEYLYWIGQAQARMTNYQAASETFSELATRFPDSPRRLEAAIAEGASEARLGQWQRLTNLLESPEGVFQQTAKGGQTNAFLAQGYLLLGEAQLALRHFDSVRTALDWLGAHAMPRELQWRREYLRCRLDLAAGHPQAALDGTTNLLALAGASAPAVTSSNAPGPAAFPILETADSPGLLAETWSFRAVILQRMHRYDDAITALTNNLDAPSLDRQRHAIFKIADLYLARTNYAEATKRLEDYLSQHPDSAATDMALLSIGELELKQYELAGISGSAGSPSAPAGTNLLDLALARFDRLLNAYPASPLKGKAHLDKGWCLWAQGQWAQCAEQFQLAAESLTARSEDQAVARFKWADAQYMLRDFAGAATNYSFVATQYDSVPDLNPQIVELALYQTVRTALTNDVASAMQAMRRIMESYPNSFAGPHCLLLMGQGLTDHGNPGAARELFDEFEQHYRTNALLPEIRLAVARTYESESDWQSAAKQYEGWLRRFPGHAEAPRAEFSRARDVYMAGQATNAFMLFTNFIARFPTNELAQQAQLWVADYYFGLQQYHDAESSYQLVYKSTNWPPSKLTYKAEMWAGRAAMASFGYKDAFGYFADLATNPVCPIDLRIKATYAAGDALMSRTDSGPTNLQEAISWFETIPQSYPTNPLAALALGSIGNCYLQMAGPDHPQFYENASNSYQSVISSPQAQIAARSQAKVGLGLVAEGLARLKTGQEKSALLQRALDGYESVFFYEDTVRPGERPDLFWVKRAGREAGRLAEAMQQWQQAINIYQELENWLPQLHLTLDKKIAEAQKNLAREKGLDAFDSAWRGK